VRRELMHLVGKHWLVPVQEEERDSLDSRVVESAIGEHHIRQEDIPIPLVPLHVHR
jgi:hypothetical protein